LTGAFPSTNIVEGVFSESGTLIPMAKKRDEPVVIPMGFEDAVKHTLKATPPPKSPPKKKAKKR
jgi:hypothetical protein